MRILALAICMIALSSAAGAEEDPRIGSKVDCSNLGQGLGSIDAYVGTGALCRLLQEQKAQAPVTRMRDGDHYRMLERQLEERGFDDTEMVVDVCRTLRNVCRSFTVAAPDILLVTQTPGAFSVTTRRTTLKGGTTTFDPVYEYIYRDPTTAADRVRQIVRNGTLRRTDIINPDGSISLSFNHTGRRIPKWPAPNQELMAEAVMANLLPTIMSAPPEGHYMTLLECQMRGQAAAKEFIDKLNLESSDDGPWVMKEWHCQAGQGSILPDQPV